MCLYSQFIFRGPSCAGAHFLAVHFIVFVSMTTSFCCFNGDSHCVGWAWSWCQHQGGCFDFTKINKFSLPCTVSSVFTSQVPGDHLVSGKTQKGCLLFSSIYIFSLPHNWMAKEPELGKDRRTGEFKLEKNAHIRKNTFTLHFSMLAWVCVIQEWLYDQIWFLL